MPTGALNNTGSYREAARQIGLVVHMGAIVAKIAADLVEYLVLIGRDETRLKVEMVKQAIQIVIEYTSQGIRHPLDASGMGFAPQRISRLPEILGDVDNVDDQGEVGQVVPHALF